MLALLMWEALAVSVFVADALDVGARCWRGQ